MDPARLPEGIPEHVLLELYVRSGRDSIERFQAAVRRWADTGSEAALADARRLAHNIKGSSWQLGLDEIATLASALEVFCADLLRPGRPVAPGSADLLQAAAGLALSALDALMAASPLPDLTDMTARLAAKVR